MGTLTATRKTAASTGTGTPQSSSFVVLSQLPGVYGDADIKAGSKSFGTDSTAALQTLFNSAANKKTLCVWWDVAVSVSDTLKLYSNVQIAGQPGAGIICRNNTNKPIFENANRTFVAGDIKDENIAIRNLTVNGNGYSYNGSTTYNQIHDSPQIGWVTPIRLFGTRNFTMDGCTILWPRTFSIHLANTDNTRLLNGNIDVGANGPQNADGIHFNGRNDSLTVQNWRIRSKDDGVALNADDVLNAQSEGGTSTFYTGMSGDITNFHISNIETYDSIFFLRLLSAKHKIENGLISNVRGYTIGYGCIIDNYWQQPNTMDDNAAGPGFVNNVHFHNYSVRSTAHSSSYLNRAGININCNCGNISFSEIHRTQFTEGDYPTILVSGAGTFVKHMSVSKYYAFDESTNENDHIRIRDAQVEDLRLEGCSVLRNTPNGSVLVKTTGSGNISRMLLSDTIAENCRYVFYKAGNRNTVNATAVNAVNTVQTGGSAAFGNASSSYVTLMHANSEVDKVSEGNWTLLAGSATGTGSGTGTTTGTGSATTTDDGTYNRQIALIDATDSGWAFTDGSWIRYTSSSGETLGAALYSTDGVSALATRTITVNERVKIKVFSNKANTYGNIVMRANGQNISVYSAYASAYQAPTMATPITVSTVLEPGTYKLELLNSPNQGRTQMIVDRIGIFGV